MIKIEKKHFEYIDSIRIEPVYDGVQIRVEKTHNKNLYQTDRIISKEQLEDMIPKLDIIGYMVDELKGYINRKENETDKI